MFIVFIIQNRCGAAIPRKSRETEAEIQPGDLRSPGLSSQPQPCRPSTVHTEGIASSTYYEITQQTCSGYKTSYQTTHRPVSIKSNYVDAKFYGNSSPYIIYNNSDEE